MKFFDAHNHLQDQRLGQLFSDPAEILDRAGTQAAVVNATSEQDWEAVAVLAAGDSRIVPAFGLHPWFLNARTPGWQRRLVDLLDAHPQAGIGEIGLDRWKQPFDLPDQVAVFSWQLAQAASRNLPVSIHCLQAWGALWDLLRSNPLPARGFLLHSYSGPAEMIGGFVALGAYFSFSPYFLHPRKERQRAAFAQMPLDRLLAETDAPDMAPPPDQNPFPLSAADGSAVNHPANIASAYAGLAQIRGVPLETLAPQLAENFARLFVECSSPLEL